MKKDYAIEKSEPIGDLWIRQGLAKSKKALTEVKKNLPIIDPDGYFAGEVKRLIEIREKVVKVWEEA